MINPDDVTDNTEMLNELLDWVWERKDRMTPDKMAFLLVVAGAEIAERHIINKERVPYLIDTAIALGREWGKNR
jgi:hypothetical protein